MPLFSFLLQDAMLQAHESSPSQPLESDCQGKQQPLCCLDSLSPTASRCLRVLLQACVSLLASLEHSNLDFEKDEEEARRADSAGVRRAMARSGLPVLLLVFTLDLGEQPLSALEEERLLLSGKAGVANVSRHSRPRSALQEDLDKPPLNEDASPEEESFPGRAQRDSLAALFYSFRILSLLLPPQSKKVEPTVEENALAFLLWIGGGLCAEASLRASGFCASEKARGEASRLRSSRFFFYREDHAEPQEAAVAGGIGGLRVLQRLWINAASRGKDSQGSDAALRSQLRRTLLFQLLQMRFAVLKTEEEGSSSARLVETATELLLLLSQNSQKEETTLQKRALREALEWKAEVLLSELKDWRERTR